MTLPIITQVRYACSSVRHSDTGTSSAGLFDYFEMKMNGNALSSKYNARNVTNQTGHEFSLNSTFSSFTITYTAALL
jgi:hypothetical protein